jgi:hypothetical protein
MPLKPARHYLRLSPKDNNALLHGLGWILYCHQVWSERKCLSYGDPRRRLVSGYDLGLFHQSLMEELLSLRLRLLRLANGGRLYFESPSDPAQCLLACRITAWRSRHQHNDSSIAKAVSPPAALCRRLEVARKRLKRAYIAAAGAERYREIALSWRSHLRWLRVHFLTCWCSSRWRSSKGNYYRRQLAIFLEHAHVGLAKQGATQIPEREVRRLVRLALSYIRRHRTPFSQRDLADDPEFAATYFSDFVLSRFKKSRIRRSTAVS